MSDALVNLVAAELAEPVDPRVTAMAAALAAQYPQAARAVLFYGSCLRSAELDGQMLDFYLIVSSYEAAYGKSWLATANRLIPPNVFPFVHNGLTAKFAMLSEQDLARECGPRARSVSVWARFAQPSRLVWAANQQVNVAVSEAIANAAPTLFQLTLPLLDSHRELSLLAVWQKGFSLTYGAELRSEKTDRSSSIVDVNPARYESFALATLARIAEVMGVGPGGEVANIASPQTMARRWRGMRRQGKLLSVLRLAKASFTFAGGIDYLAWKVSRHSGVPVTIRPWHRRAPLVAALVLLPRLLTRGAIR